MNDKFSADEFSAQIYSLLDNGEFDAAIKKCDQLAKKSSGDPEVKVTALLLRAFSHMAAGDTEKAVNDHLSAFSAADDLTAIDQLGVAESALKAQLPFDFCADLFELTGERLEAEGGDPSMAAGAFNKAGICLFRHGAPTEEEKECFHRAISILDYARRDKLSREHREVLYALIQSNLAECVNREGDTVQATELYEAASEVFRRHLGDEDNMCLTHYAICQRCLSDLYRNSEENIRAHTCLSRSIAELERRRSKLPDPLRLHLAVCYNARGTLRFQMGDYEGEVDDCTQSLLLREDLEDDPNAQATVISNRAEAYSMLDQFEPARQDFIRAVEMLDGIPDSAPAALSAATRSYSLGLLYSKEQMHEEACEAFRSAAGRFSALRSAAPEDIEYTPEQLADLESLARMRLSASIYQCRERDYFEAITEGRESIRLLEQLPMTVERAARLAALHISMGELLEMFDELEAADIEYDRAEDYRDKGIALVMSGEDPDYSEEDIYEEFDDQRGIWEDFSDHTPQG